MKKLSVLILAQDEESNISDCIKSVRFADEVVVIDSGSSDRTVAIAKKAGAKVVRHPMKKGFAEQRNFALKKTTAEWVLFLDADERIPGDLRDEIVRTVGGEPAAYEIPRLNHAFGHPLRHGGWYPDYCLRLYPRTAVKWTGIVHERPETEITRKRLSYPMIHFTYTDWRKYFLKIDSYTTLMAKRNAEAGKGVSFFDIAVRPPVAFARMYLVKSGWRDGGMGFVMAWFHAFYIMTKYVKQYYQKKDS